MLNKEGIIKATRELYNVLPEIMIKMTNMSFWSITWKFIAAGRGEDVECSYPMAELATRRDEVFRLADEFNRLTSIRVEIPFSIGSSTDAFIIDIEHMFENETFLMSGYTMKDACIFFSKRDIHRISKNLSIEEDPVDGFDLESSINFIPKVIHHKCFIAEGDLMKEVAAAEEEVIDWAEESYLKPEFEERDAERSYLKELIEQLHYASELAYPGNIGNKFQPTLMKRLVNNYVALPVTVPKLNKLIAACELNDAGTDYVDPQTLREFHNAMCNQVDKRCERFKEKYNYDIVQDMREEGFYLFGNTKASGDSDLADLAEF